MNISIKIIGKEGEFDLECDVSAPCLVNQTAEFIGGIIAEAIKGYEAIDNENTGDEK